jgi:hypothetical protein|tara:strand:+ start:1152 stop:1532 length:381 start_codon:yes stop_codon:yes gene_type:complete
MSNWFDASVKFLTGDADVGDVIKLGKKAYDVYKDRKSDPFEDKYSSAGRDRVSLGGQYSISVDTPGAASVPGGIPSRMTNTAEAYANKWRATFASIRRQVGATVAKPKVTITSRINRRRSGGSRIV